MEYLLEQDVPVPFKKRPKEKRPVGRPPGTKYPFADMKPGDSFLIPGVDYFSVRDYRKYQKPGTKFITRKNVKGVRVFCVAEEGETP